MNMTMKEKYKFEKMQYQTMWHKNNVFNLIISKLSSIMFYSQKNKDDFQNINCPSFLYPNMQTVNHHFLLSSYIFNSY